MAIRTSRPVKRKRSFGKLAKNTPKKKAATGTVFVASTRRTAFKKRPSRLRPKRRAQRSLGRGPKLSYSSFRIGAGPRLFRGFKRVRQPTTFTCTHTQRINASTAGNQKLSLLPTFNFTGASDGSPVLADFVTVSEPLVRRFGKWLNAWENAPVTAEPSAVAPTSDAWQGGHPYTQKFVVHYLQYDMAIRNMANQDTTITLYDCVMRPGVSPLLRNVGTTNEGIDPLLDWADGMYYTQHPGRQSALDGSNSERPGCTPFRSPNFCKLYKIRKVTKKTLPPGEVHHHQITVKPRQMFDYQYGTAQQRYIPGLTSFTIIVSMGSVVHSSVTNTEISTAPHALDVVTICKGSCASFTRERKNHLAFDNLPATPSGMNAVWRGVNDETDAGVDASAV